LTSIPILAKVMIHIQCRSRTLRPSNRLGRNAGNRGVRLNRIQHNTTCTDFCALTYFNIPEDFRSNPD
jgi:hypothetical protein